MFRVAHSGLEPLPHLSNPGFNPFINPFQRFFAFTPALKPPVEDNGPMWPTPGVHGFYWRQTPICPSEGRLTGLEAIKYGARTEDLFI
jgi:hypothetical protein